MDTAQIINDMDLVLEGIPFSMDNQNVINGLSILEHNAPEFKYSRKNMNLLEKIDEIKKYYYNLGYDNNSILDIFSSIRKTK